MKVLKGFGLGILGFLLYLALSVFGLVFVLNSTILNPNFMVAEIVKLDITTIAKDIARDRISAQFSPDMAKLAAPILDNALNELKPWINEQVRTAVFSGYDYLLGNTPELKITLQLDTVRETVIKNIRNAPEVQQVPPALRDQLLNPIIQQISAQIPSTYTIDKNMLGSEGMNALAQARQVAGYFKLAYTVLIALIIVLILAIILIHREVRGASRQLGTIILISGVLDFAAFYFASTMIPGQIAAISGLPAAVQAWLPQVLTDFMASFKIYSIVLVVVGVVLLVVSFVYKPASEASG